MTARMLTARSSSASRQLPTLGALAGILCVYVLLGSFGIINPIIMWIGVAVFGAGLLIGTYGAVKAIGAPWEIRLDPAGVTVRGHEVRPWSAFAEIRISSMRPRWFFFVSLGYRVVAFVGKPGVELPMLPSARFGGRSRGSARLGHRWYGKQLLLTPFAYNASTTEMAAATRRFSDVPVREL